MRFLITGGSGWIGFALVRHLSRVYGKKNLQLIINTRSSHEKEEHRKKDLIKERFDIIFCDLLEDNIDIKKIKPFDVLYHLAAYTEVESKSYKVHVNDIGTEKLLMSLKGMLQGKRVVFTGSILSMDRKRPSNKPLSENSPCNPRTEYGRTKLKGESFIEKYAGIYGFEWVIMRIPTVYGPGFRPGGMFGVIPKKLKKNSFEIRLNWPGKLSIVYIEDCVKALLFLGAKKIKCNEIYNISSGENPTFDFMIDQIAHFTKTKRSHIKMPVFFWGFVRFVVWFPGMIRILPFKLRISLWRASLIVIDGLVFESSKLNKILPFEYTPLKIALPRTYKG